MRPLVKTGTIGLGLVLMVASLSGPATSFAAVAWSVREAAQPSEFAPAAGNRYQLVVESTGSEMSSSAVTLTDRLPAGLTMASYETGESREGAVWGCGESEPSVVTCMYQELSEEEPAGLKPGDHAPSLSIEVSAPSESAEPLENQVSVSGGGATVSAMARETTPVGTAPQTFGITDFTMEANTASGEAETRIGGHPWQITTSLGFPWTTAPPNLEEHRAVPVENVKKVTVELPAGLLGNPLATERCTQFALFHQACPPGSQIGSVAIAGGLFIGASFYYTGRGASKVYNMVSDSAAPVEFAFTYEQQATYLYASIVHTASGERVRITTVGVTPFAEVGNVVLTLWGEPGSLNGSGSTAAFITNPVDCTEAPAKARVEAESWGNPGHPVSRETTVYQGLTGCGGLQSLFTPSLSLSPLAGGEGGTTQADAPSGFQGAVNVPQNTGFEELAVPEVRDVSASAPVGVSISPATAQGLVACKERGPEGINLGTSTIGPGGVDEGNPEATELGAGHRGGNSSPFDDGQYHTAPGHCPEASTIGSVEVFTPLLPTRCGGKDHAVGEEQAPCKPGESPAPLQGHAYVAQPKCGGVGQASCTPADAEDGTAFAGYVELAGDGIRIKERATVSVNQSTGQVSLHVRDLPQFPFSELKLRLEGGPFAPLATPQTCGPAVTDSVFRSWSSVSEGEVFAAAPSAFTVDGDGNGAACPAVWPFAPGFMGGSVSTQAGGFTHFVTSLTRKDREQNVTGLSVTPPLGLLAMISSVTPCPEPQAAAGECPESSLVGHDTAGVGSGSAPFYVSGRVYLTGPYKGAPYGLDVLTPAVAGPFNLGNVLVRARINVDPATAAVTITSDPIPQFHLGVPLRLKALNVTIDREGFVFNPTNCTQQQLTGTAAGDQGATAPLSAPFNVTGCAGLPSNPAVHSTVPGKASKKGGAGLVFTTTSSKGQAGIKSVKVNAPKQLPARLTTLQKACPDTVFKANSAGCPAGSVVGSAVLHTPVLKSPLTGPIYLVSHGGAAFPDLVIVLQAEGITIQLDGTTNIKHGVISETFKSVPDAPFTSFTATLAQGPHSLLATNLPKKAKYNFCGQKLNMPIRITAQNNIVTAKTLKVAITGCKKRPKSAHH